MCVQQTCRDLLSRGKRVSVLVDGTSSQSPSDREVALAHMRALGAELTTSASVLFEIMASAEHPHFKAVSKLVVDARAALDNTLSLR